ncbi:hypothetical protein BJ170DRAFT_684757 [Xylariales sp. AK1849]|nr:hypothetical protein BJ170DRAFT_684757 [Xylariales sp. AK1849]
MATPRFARTLTCPNCLGRLPLRRPAASTPSPSQLGLTQVRYARTLTKAELEDLQGIPVRLLQDIIGFGRKNAIIRVKPGRMRNVWHHKSLAEYMTKKRFTELGLTEAAIGVRDRSFGTQMLVQEDKDAKAKKLVEEGPTLKRKEAVTMLPEESRTLLNDLLPEVLVFTRKPISAPTTLVTSATSTPAEPAPELEPTVTRSPSLAANAATSPAATPSARTATASTYPATPAAEPAADTTSIFGSVSPNDILTRIREALLADRNGSRVALEAEGITILGMEEGEDRIKRLGRWEIDIVTGKGSEPVQRVVEVVAEEEV